MRSLRIVLLGDELLTGAGDPKGMGWVGRIQQRLPNSDDILLFSLAMPNETSAGVLRRWREEALPRFSEQTENYLVIALGAADVATGTSLSRSRLNLASVLDDAKRERVGVFVIGPAPTGIPTIDNKLSELTMGYQDVVQRRGLNFVDCFHPLQDHAGWKAELDQSPVDRPGQVGYGLIAWLVLNRGWFEWLALSERD